MDLHKDDVPILDFLLSKMVDKDSDVYADHLKELDQYSDSNQDTRINKFKEVMVFFRIFNCAEPHDDDRLAQWIRPNMSTAAFLKSGGFKAKYDELVEKDRILKLEIRKTEVDLDLAKKTLKEFPKTKWYARIGLFIAVVLALKELYIWIMQLSSQ